MSRNKNLTSIKGHYSIANLRKMTGNNHSLGLVNITLVNVYVDLVVFTRIACTLKTGSGRYWPKYYVEKHAICLKDYTIRSFLSIRHADGDLSKHLRIDSSTDLDNGTRIYS